MKTLFIIIVLLLTFCPAFGQKSKAPGYQIRASKGSVAITYKGKAHWLDLRQRIDAARITETELEFATEKKGFRYLLIDVIGWSRREQNDRQCGAGEEANMIWVKLDAAWKILDVKSVRYQSCWSGEEVVGNYQRTNDQMSFEFYTKGGTAKLSYNANEPEKGFLITEQPDK